MTSVLATSLGLAAPVDAGVMVKARDSEGVIFPATSVAARAEWFPKPGHAFWTPTSADVSRAEAHIQKDLGSTSFKLSRKLTEYRRQYFGFVEGGKKMILCNFFTQWDWHPDWATVPVQKAGGHADFIVIYDVDGGTIHSVYSTSSGSR